MYPPVKDPAVIVAVRPLPEESTAIVPLLSSIFHQAPRPLVLPNPGFTTTLNSAFVTAPFALNVSP